MPAEAPARSRRHAASAGTQLGGPQGGADLRTERNGDEGRGQR